MFLSIYKKIPLFSLPIFVLLSGCGKPKDNIIPSLKVSSDKVYFLVQNTQTLLESVQLQDQTVSLEPAPADLSNDVVGFETFDSNHNLKHIGIVDRSSQKPVLLYDTSGEAKESQFQMPENISDMLLDHHQYYFIGLNQMELNVASDDLQKEIQPSHQLAGFNNTTLNSQSFQDILKNGENTYILSMGDFPTPGFATENASIYLLDPSLQARSKESPNSWPIEADWNNIHESCYRITDSLRVSNKTYLIACNNNEVKDKSWTSSPSVFLVQVENKVPNVTLLAIGDNMVNFRLGGVSLDKSHAFLTEEVLENGDWQNPSVKQAYWLDLNNQDITMNKQMTSGVAYQMTYNKNQQAYIFSCSLNEKNQCQENTFGKLQTSPIEPFPKKAHSSLILNNLKNIWGIRGIEFLKEIDEDASQSSTF